MQHLVLGWLCPQLSLRAAEWRGSGVLGGVDDMKNVLTSKASEVRNALMRCQQSLGSSFCSCGKSLVNWKWVGKLWDRKKCVFRCGLGSVWCIPPPRAAPFAFCSAQCP